MEDAALKAALGQDCEEALDSVEPRGRRRSEVENPSWVTRQPFAHGRVLVDGVVVEDRVNDFANGNLLLDGVKKANELLMAVALHVAADDLAVEYVHRRKQGRRPVALIVVGHGSGPALLDRQARLRSVERLDLALLIEAEHNGRARADRRKARQCRATCRRTRDRSKA